MPSVQLAAEELEWSMEGPFAQAVDLTPPQVLLQTPSLLSSLPLCSLPSLLLFPLACSGEAFVNRCRRAKLSLSSQGRTFSRPKCDYVSTVCTT